MTLAEMARKSALELADAEEQFATAKTWVELEAALEAVVTVKDFINYDAEYFTYRLADMAKQLESRKAAWRAS